VSASADRSAVGPVSASELPVMPLGVYVFVCGQHGCAKTLHWPRYRSGAASLDEVDEAKRDPFLVAAGWSYNRVTGWLCDVHSPVVVPPPPPGRMVGPPPEVGPPPAAGPGRIAVAVERDLARMGALDTGVRGSLGELARVLAIKVDEAVDGGAPLAQVVKAMQELRVVLRQMVEVRGDGDLAKALRRIMSAPVRDGADAGAGDAGPAGDGDVGVVAAPVHAAPEADR
jgi:hypothetical protein